MSEITSNTNELSLLLRDEATLAPNLSALSLNRFLLPIFALILVSSAFSADNSTKPNQPTLAGGYSSAEIDPEVRTVAEFAVKTQGKSTGRPLQLIKILKAERQVVAGLNYRLEIEVAAGSKHLKARAVVWKKLDGSLMLTTWEPLR